MVKGVKKEMKPVQPKGKYLTQSEFLNNLCCETGLTRKEGKNALNAVQTIGTFEVNIKTFSF